MFRVTRSGEESVLYSFKGGSDGAVPEGELIAVGGLLYGTTSHAGSVHGAATQQLPTSGQEAVLHNFFPGAPSDGETLSDRQARSTCRGPQYRFHDHRWRERM